MNAQIASLLDLIFNNPNYILLGGVCFIQIIGFFFLLGLAKAAGRDAVHTSICTCKVFFGDDPNCPSCHPRKATAK